MALIVEDGTGVAGANAYQSEAQIIAYAARYDVEITTDEAEKAGLKATDAIEIYKFQGERVDRDQSLSFPRYGVEYDGFYYESTTIPPRFLTAYLELCLLYAQGIDILEAIERQTKEESFAVFKVVYDDNSDSQAQYQKFESMIAPFLYNHSVINFSSERSYR